MSIGVHSAAVGLRAFIFFFRFFHRLSSSRIDRQANCKQAAVRRDGEFWSAQCFQALVVKLAGLHFLLFASFAALCCLAFQAPAAGVDLRGSCSACTRALL